ncbi:MULTISPECIES: SRPBCC family protein [Amycolatopsis]|uniref:SRPBCC family protein n=1 Tax=Amycolatopsis sp. WAC 04197 TaxID=2203199 RepID=UPI000F78998D|nr:SRPBCC family protein [Amycolatopsis sp. WAC 04197]RSN39552.1 actinorhodin polyketide synthase [Amycolatopsis sp. WAC 04197]
MAKETEHRIKVQAPAAVVYGLVADVAAWPSIFPPTVHIECLERNGSTERLQIWATANGEVKTWTSRRELDADELRVSFRQERSAPPVAAMGGAWIVEPLSDTETLVRLLHDFEAVGDDPENVAWIERAVGHNSEAELAALKEAAERVATEGEGATLTFTDEVWVAGSGADVYDFLNEADRWPDRLPHVDKVSLTEPAPGLQELEMDTRTGDGSVHTTKSIRVCRPHSHIVYKQLHLPALLSVHTGQWTIVAEPGGVLVRSAHTVTIKESAIEEVLGDHATLADARTFIREALGRNSTTTMRHAKEYAESRGAGVSAELYTSLQAFYARQMRLLDNGEAERWAETFTEDGVFAQNAKPRPMSGRADIAASMRRGLDRLAATGLRRRHWTGMLEVEPLPGGEVRTNYYALVISTPKGGKAELYLSTTCSDLLVRWGNGWLVRHRQVDHDNV